MKTENKWVSQKRYYLKNREKINARRRAKTEKDRAYKIKKKYEGVFVDGHHVWGDESKGPYDAFKTKFKYSEILTDNKQTPLVDAIVAKLAIYSAMNHFDSTYKMKSNKPAGSIDYKWNGLWPYKDIHRFLKLNDLIPDSYERSDVVGTCNVFGLYVGTAQFSEGYRKTRKEWVMKPVRDGHCAESSDLEELKHIFPFFKHSYISFHGNQGPEYMAEHAVAHLNVVRATLGLPEITKEVLKQAEDFIKPLYAGRVQYFEKDEIREKEGKMTNAKIQEVIDSI